MKTTILKKLAFAMLIVVSKTVADSRNKNNILCWKKLKTGTDQKLTRGEIAVYTLPQYNDITSCCQNGGIATTIKSFPWDKTNLLSISPTPCKESNLIKCNWTCQADTQKVCGSDGKTYASKCQLEKAACMKSKTLKFTYNGECKQYCQNVQCLSGKSCVYDQVGVSYCIERNCQCEPEGGKVCGLDNITYQTQCHLLRAACRKHKIIPVRYYEMCNNRKTCSDIKCNANEACIISNDGFPKCIKCCQSTLRSTQVSLKICGSNGKTYNDWCDLRADSCSSGKLITAEIRTNGCQRNTRVK